MRPRKPFWGNLALATTLLLINTFRLVYFALAAILLRKNRCG